MANSAFTHDPQITVPGSSTDNAVVIFDGTSGSGFGNSTIIVDSGGNGRIGIAGDTDVITLTSGVVTIAGTVAATTLTGAGAGITALSAANITASGTLPVLNGSALTNLDADDLATGTVPVARLGDGNESNSTFLRGDNTWVAVSGTTINTNADNRVITGSGTANTLNGESNLTFSTDLTITSGNLVLGTAGKGIDFSVNTSSYPSGSSVTSGNEILDYYEEGQFIPHVWDSNKTTNSSVTYNNRLGRYTRIGNIVFFTISWNPLSVSALTQTSNAHVGGLPFTCSNTNYGSSTALRHGLALGYIAGLSMPSNTSMIQARMDANRADLDITWTNTGSQAGGIAYAKVQELGGDWIIDITGHYEVA